MSTLCVIGRLEPMSSPEMYYHDDESTEEFSERVMFEWFMPGVIGAIAVEAAAFIGGVNEPIEAGIGTVAFIVLHKVLQKLDIFERRRQT